MSDLFKNLARFAKAFPQLKMCKPIAETRSALSVSQVELYRTIHAKHASNVYSGDELTTAFIDSLTNSGDDCENLVAVVVAYLRLPQACQIANFINLPTDDNINPLFDCVERNAMQAVLALVQCGGADVNWQVDDTCALTFSANHGDMTRLLVSLGANVNGFSGGNTPLHQVVTTASTLQSTSMLLIAGADMTAKNKDGLTPFRLALSATWPKFGRLHAHFMIIRASLSLEDVSMLNAVCKCMSTSVNMSQNLGKADSIVRKHDYEALYSSGAFGEIDLDHDTLEVLVDIIHDIWADTDDWPSALCSDLVGRRESIAGDDQEDNVVKYNCANTNDDVTNVIESEEEEEEEDVVLCNSDGDDTDSSDHGKDKHVAVGGGTVRRHYGREDFDYSIYDSDDDSEDDCARRDDETFVASDQEDENDDYDDDDDDDNDDESSSGKEKAVSRLRRSSRKRRAKKAIGVATVSRKKRSSVRLSEKQQIVNDVDRIIMPMSTTMRDIAAVGWQDRSYGQECYEVLCEFAAAKNQTDLTADHWYTALRAARDVGDVDLFWRIHECQGFPRNEIIRDFAFSSEFPTNYLHSIIDDFTTYDSRFHGKLLKVCKRDRPIGDKCTSCEFLLNRKDAN